MPMDTHLGATQWEFNNVSGSPVTIDGMTWDGFTNEYTLDVDTSGILRRGIYMSASSHPDQLAKLRMNNVPSPATGDFALSMWYRPIDHSTLNQPVAGNKDGTTAWTLMYNNGSNSKNLTLLDGNGAVVLEGSVPLPARYSHIILQRESGVVSLYVNGTLAGSTSFTQNITYPSNRLFIGSANQVDTDLGTYNWYRHLLDEVRIKSGMGADPI